MYKTLGYKMPKNCMTGSMFQVSEKGSYHKWKKQMGYLSMRLLGKFFFFFMGYNLSHSSVLIISSLFDDLQCSVRFVAAEILPGLFLNSSPCSNHILPPLQGISGKISIWKAGENFSLILTCQGYKICFSLVFWAVLEALLERLTRITDLIASN